MSDATLSTLNKIRTKVRRLTRSPSTNQLSNDNLDDYINTAVLYDFPQDLRLFTLKTIFVFYTDPYIDRYVNNTTDANDLLYNFINKYTALQAPVYCAGELMYFTQDETQFFTSYPKNQLSKSIGTGNGSTVAYSGTLTDIPVLRNNILFSSVNTANAGLAVYDNGSGGLVGDVTATGTINYVTGAYSFTFTSAPANGTEIYAQTVAYTASKPNSILYYNNVFTLRPVPDQPYKIEIEAYARPTELLSSTQQPDLAQWWQYIAYLAAKKIFQDRMDTVSLNAIAAEFKNQENLVRRHSISQITNQTQRAMTIYSNQTEVDSHTVDYNEW